MLSPEERDLWQGSIVSETPNDRKVRTIVGSVKRSCLARKRILGILMLRANDFRKGRSTLPNASQSILATRREEGSQVHAGMYDRFGEMQELLGWIPVRAVPGLGEFRRGAELRGMAAKCIRAWRTAIKTIPRPTRTITQSRMRVGTLRIAGLSVLGQHGDRPEPWRPASHSFDAR